MQKLLACKNLKLFLFCFFSPFLFNIKSYLCWKSYHSSVHCQSTWREFLVAPHYFPFLYCLSTSHIKCSKRLWLPPSFCSAALFDSRGIITCVLMSTASPAFEFRAHCWLFKMHGHSHQYAHATMSCLSYLVCLSRCCLLPHVTLSSQDYEGMVSKKREHIMTPALSQRSKGGHCPCMSCTLFLWQVIRFPWCHYLFLAMEMSTGCLRGFWMTVSAS